MAWCDVVVQLLLSFPEVSKDARWTTKQLTYICIISLGIVALSCPHGSKLRSTYDSKPMSNSSWRRSDAGTELVSFSLSGAWE